MCNFKSFLVLKPEQEGARPRILHKHGIDSHTELMDALNVRERSSASAADQPLAKVECVPDFTKDLTLDESWSFRLDEERTPDWWGACKEWAEKECRRICRSLVATSGEREGEDVIVAENGSVTVKSGRVWATKGSRVEAWGSSRVVARHSSRVEAWGSSRVEARGSSRVEARDSSSVVAWDSSSVVAWDSSRVVARHSSSVVAWDYSSVEAWDSSSVETKSKYAICARRARWDGSGHPWSVIPFSESAK